MTLTLPDSGAAPAHAMMMSLQTALKVGTPISMQAWLAHLTDCMGSMGQGGSVQGSDGRMPGAFHTACGSSKLPGRSVSERCRAHRSTMHAPALAQVRVSVQHLPAQRGLYIAHLSAAWMLPLL